MPTVTKFPTANIAAFTNAANGHADDGAYATAAPGRNAAITEYWYGFGFAIPTDATINSVVIECQFKVSTNGSIATLYLQAARNGVGQGTYTSDATEPLTDKTITCSTTGTWTPAQLNDNGQTGLNIGVQAHRGASSTAVTFSVDYVKATVTYTEATPTAQGGVGTIHTQGTAAGGSKTGQGGIASNGAAAAAAGGSKLTQGGAGTTDAQATAAAGQKTASGSAPSTALSSSAATGQKSTAGAAAAGHTTGQGGSGVKAAAGSASSTMTVTTAAAGTATQAGSAEGYASTTLLAGIVAAGTKLARAPPAGTSPITAPAAAGSAIRAGGCSTATGTDTGAAGQAVKQAGTGTTITATTGAAGGAYTDTRSGAASTRIIAEAAGGPYTGRAGQAGQTHRHSAAASGQRAYGRVRGIAAHYEPRSTWAAGAPRTTAGTRESISQADAKKGRSFCVALAPNSLAYTE